MAATQSLRRELDELRREFESWRSRDGALPSGKSAEPFAATAKEPSGVEGQIAELSRMVHALFDKAEESVSQHPVATVAGRLPSAS